MSKNRCLPRVLAIACFALSLPAHADDVPVPGRAAVQVDEATLLIDGAYDHGILQQTTKLETAITCSCELPSCDPDNVAEPDQDIKFCYQASVTLFLFDSATRGPVYHSFDAAALVTKCVGPDCEGEGANRQCTEDEDVTTGSYALVREDPLKLVFQNVVLLDLAANLVAKGVTYECDDNVERVIVVDTPNTFDMGDERSGFGW